MIADQSTDLADARPHDTKAGAWWGPSTFFLLLTGFFLVHWLLRPWLTATAGSDDADQLLFSQGLAWGYSLDQQPLYSWLLWLIAKLLGPTILAAALLKYGLVFAISTFTYLIGRRLIRDERLQLLTGFSPMLIYPLAWRLHEADTHGVLASVLVLAALWLALRTAATRRTADYLLLGVVLGLGLLTSLWVLAALAAIGIAGLRRPNGRTVALDRRYGLTAAVALCLLAPHAAWLIEHGPAAAATFERNLRDGLAEGWLARLGPGLAQWAETVVLVTFPFWFLFALLFPQALRRLHAPDAAPAREADFLARYLVALLAVLTVFIVAGGITGVSQYRLYPLFLPFLPYMFWRADNAEISVRPIRWLAILLAVLFVMVVQLRIQQIFVGPAYCKTCRLQAPYPAIAETLAADGFDGQGTIVADDEYLAGNMRVQFPQATVLSARYPLFRPQPAGAAAGCLLTWDTTYGEQPPTRLGRLAEELGVDPAALPIRVAEAVVPYSDTAIAPRRTIRIAYALSPDSVGQCR